MTQDRYGYLRALAYLLLLGMILFTLSAQAQNVRFDGQVANAYGQPIPGAFVAVCTQPCTVPTNVSLSSLPSPLASLCSSASDNVCASPNPITGDGIGNYNGYVKPGAYTLVFFGSGLATRTQIDQNFAPSISSANTWTAAQTFSIRDLVYQVHPVDGELSAAVNAKLALCGTSPCSTEAAPGSYTATGPITFQYDRQNFRCAGGPQGTVITFNPASTASLFVLHKADNTAAIQNQLIGCSMVGGGSQTKTALEIFGGTSFTVTDFAAINLTEAGSIGVRMRGHQFIHLLRPVISNTSNPVWISADTTSNAGGIDNDFTFIQHATLGLPPADTTHAGVTFDQDLNVTNFKMQQFDIAGGNKGVYWPADSVGGKPVALGTSFQDGRVEQQLGTTPWAFDIEKPHVGLIFSNINVGSGSNGFKLRNTKWVSLRDIRVADGTKISLDLDGTAAAVQHVELSNFFDQVGATRNLTNMVKIASGPTYNQAGPSWALYETSSAADQSFHVGQTLLIESAAGFVQFGGTTSSFTGLRNDSGNLGVFKADGSAYGRLNLGTLAFPNGTGGAVTDTSGSGSKLLTNSGASATNLTLVTPTLGVAAATSITMSGGTAPVVGSPTVGQAACIKAAGPPVVIGYCSTVVSAGGACTCN